MGFCVIFPRYRVTVRLEIPTDRLKFTCPVYAIRKDAPYGGTKVIARKVPLGALPPDPQGLTRQCRSGS